MAQNQKKRRVAMKKQLRNFAARITNQEILDHCLLPVQDVEQRQVMYQRLRPLLKFHSHFPTHLTVFGDIARP